MPRRCIYAGARKLYIHSTECIDRGACEPACPVEAISPDALVKPEYEHFVAGEVEFFDKPLPGRADALGSPGGAEALRAVGADVALVAGYPYRGVDREPIQPLLY